METVQIRSLGHTVARYLLFALLGLLFLDIVFGTGSILSFLSLAGVTAALFLALTIDAIVNETEAELPQQESAEWTWLGEQRWETVILVGLVVAGLVLRVYALGEQSFWFDEAITTNAAMSLLDDGRPTFPSGFTYWRAFTHTVVVSASMLVFGTSEWAARFPSVIFGGVTIIFTYWLGREIGEPRVGLLAAGLITFATWEIAWSRQARMYQLFQLLYILSVVVLLRVEQRGLHDKRLLGVLVVVIGLAAATHPIGYVLLPVAVVFLATAAVFDGAVTRRTAGIIVGIAIVLTVLFEIIGPSITGAVETITVTKVDYWDAYVSWFATELYAFLYLAVVGASVTVYTGARRAGLLYGLAVVLPVVILSFSTKLFATRYLYFVLPFVFVWAAVTVVFVADQLTEAQSVVKTVLNVESRQFVPVVSIVLVCLLLLGGGFTMVPQQEYQLGVNAPQPDFKSAYGYVNENRYADDIIIAGWTAPGLYYAGKVDYWLAHDLSGTGGTYTINSKEKYAGAEPIRTVSELNWIVSTYDRGWVIVDRRALHRQDEQLYDRIENGLTQERKQEDISIYSWGIMTDNETE